jgi:uncharacterized membrane protein
MNIAELYETITIAIGQETGASDSLLHVHAGMAVLLAARIISGRSLATPVPFLVVCLFALGNEILDRINHGVWRWMDTSLDILNTIFWPLVLMIGLRMRRSRDAARRAEQQH